MQPQTEEVAGDIDHICLRSRLRTIFAVCAGNKRAAEIAVDTVTEWLHSRKRLEGGFSLDFLP